MKYVKVKWEHEPNQYPKFMYSELSNSNHETRKVEVFCDGSYGFAEEGKNKGSTVLGELPLPTLDDINRDTQFLAENISKVEFEEVWCKAQ